MIINLQTILDKSDLTQRLYGKLRLEAIRKRFTKGKIKSILGHDPHKSFFNNYSQKYGISVEEGNYSTSQRQTELQQYLHFKELGMPIADKTIMRAAFITNKKLAIQEMEEQTEQANQVQQQQMQQQAQIDQTKMMLDQAKTQTEMAKSQELVASAHEKVANIENIEAEAEQRNLEVDLNLVKLAMELEDVQFKQIREAFELAQSVKLANQNEINTQNV